MSAIQEAMRRRHGLTVQLQGGTITEAWIEDSYGIQVPVLRVQMPSGVKYHVFIQTDAEGNDGGYLHIEVA